MAVGSEEREMVQIIRLISAIHRLQENVLDRYAQANWGLTSGQLRLVATLQPGQPMRTLELARRLYTDPGTVSGLLRRLTQKGLVVCRQSPDDRRVQLVDLTEQGAQVRHQFMARALWELPTTRFVEHLRHDERRHLLAALIKYASHLMGPDDVREFLTKVEESLAAPAPSLQA